MNDTSAIPSDDGTLFYQPITDYVTNQTIGALYQHLIFDAETGQTTQIGLSQGYSFHLDINFPETGLFHSPFVANVSITYSV